MRVKSLFGGYFSACGVILGAKWSPGHRLGLQGVPGWVLDTCGVDFGDPWGGLGPPWGRFWGSRGVPGEALDQPCGYLEAPLPTWVRKNAQKTEKKGCPRRSMKKYRKSDQNDSSQTTKIIVLLQ